MAYSIIAAGGSLYRMTTAGVATALTLPTDVTLSSTRPARMAVLGRNVAVVNGANRSLVVDPLGTVRHMQLTPPASPVILAAGSAGSLSGTFQVKYTYITKDPVSGALLAESDFSPASAASSTLTSDLLNVTGIGLSPDSDVTHRRLYRTATGPGSTYFHWIDVDGNTITATSNDMSDTALSVVAAPTERGVAPGAILGTYMTRCVEWKQRLWGVGDLDVDTLRYSGSGTYYGWPATYGFSIAPVGADEFGITGLMPRRDELGIARRNILWKIIHNGTNSDGTPNFEAIRVYNGKGCWAPDSVVVSNDVAYFLGEDGIYTWDSSGIRCISDEAGVRKWFTSTTYFNKAQFQNAFAHYNSVYNTYELHLAAAGSSNIDRWIAYDIKHRRFFGPHLTSAFTPSAALQLYDADSQAIPVLGNTTGFVSQKNQTAFTDWTSAIAMSLTTKFHDGQTPDITKQWLQPALLNAIQASAGTLTMGVYRGDLNASLTKTYTADMTKGRQRFSRIGAGRFVQFVLAESTNNLGAEIFGYELPFFELGRR